jgi:hypothetical protein
MEKISAFLRTARGGGQQALQGQVFETMIHRLINIVGCSGDIRYLQIDKKRKRGIDNGSSSTFSLRPLIRKNFASLADLDPTAYNVPLSRSFAAVDALLPSRGLLLQMTIAATHPIKIRPQNVILFLKSRPFVFQLYRLKDSSNSQNTTHTYIL